MVAEGRAGWGPWRPLTRPWCRAARRIHPFRRQAIEELAPLAAAVRRGWRAGAGSPGTGYISSLQGARSAMAAELELGSPSQIRPARPPTPSPPALPAVRRDSPSTSAIPAYERVEAPDPLAPAPQSRRTSNSSTTYRGKPLEKRHQVHHHHPQSSRSPTATSPASRSRRGPKKPSLPPSRISARRSVRKSRYSSPSPPKSIP